MSDGSKPSPELTGIRLKFQTSSELQTRLRFFLNAETQQYIRTNNGRIKLISRRVRYLDLGGKPGSSGKDIERYKAFSRKVEDKTNIHTFQLKSKVAKDEEVEDGIELKFNVDLATDDERKLIVAEPFMTPGSKAPFEIYAAIPQKALATPEALAHAYELLELSMTPPIRPGEAPPSIAPFGMNVRDAEIDRIPPQLRIVGTNNAE